MKTPWRIAVLLPLAALCLTGCIKPEKEVLTVQTTRIEMPAHQSTPFLFEIWANFLWTIETADSWLYVNLNQAYGDKVIEVSVSPNTSLSPRTTRFHIAGTSARQTVEVIQLGEEPTITFKNSSMTVSADGGTAEMEVSTNVEVNLSIDVPWVKFVSTRLISSSIYSFQVEQNTGLTPRTAKITFSQRNGPLRQELTITQTGEAPAIVPSRTVVSVGATGGDQMLTISSNVPYTASCPDDWVVIIPTKLMTEDVFFFNVRPNPRVETRETELIFTGPGSPPTAVASLLVRQDGAAAVATFFPTQYINVPAIASVDKYRVDVAANFNWTVDFSKTDPWVTGITFDAHSCSFNVLANNEMSLRTTTIVFRQTGVLEANAYVREYTISQQAASPQLSFLPLQANMPELSGDRDSVLVLVTANLPWVQQIDQNWASFEERHVNGLPANTRAFMLKVQENTASSRRTARIHLISSAVTRTITITQREGQPRLSVNPRRIEAPTEGMTRVITISSNVGWNRVNASSWVTVGATPPTRSPLTDTTLLVTVGRNTSFNPRIDTIFIRQNSGSLRDTVAIYQAGVSPTFSASSPRASASGAGDNSFVVNINANYPIAYAGVDRSWVSATIDSVSGVRYSFRVAPTTSGVSRTATISFKNTNGEAELIKTYTLIQRGATVSVADSTVLTRLYRAATGVIWQNGWDLSNPVFTWSGVTLTGIIDGELRVRELNLSGRRLFGLLVGGIQEPRVPLEELEYLEKLNLSNNPSLAGELPVDLFRLRYLKELDLSNCNFSNGAGGRNIPEQWGGRDSNNVLYFSELEVLRVFGNMLNGIIPVRIKDHDNWDKWDWERNIRPQKSGNELTAP